MHTNQYFGLLTNPIYGLVVLLVLAVFLKSPAIKTVVSKLHLNLAIKFLDKNIYTLFKNVALATGAGIIQIEYIIVSRYGVFVINTADIKDLIFENFLQETCVQSIEPDASLIQNPLHGDSNQSQIWQTALEITPNKVVTMTILVGDTTLKTTVPDNVVYPGSCVQFIKDKTRIVFKDEEVLDICNKIQAAQLKPSINSDIDHIQHIKAMVANKPRPHDILCPKCGQKMILRSALRNNYHGKQFLGCSNFPKCKMIRQII
jgi:restriction system protein